MPLLQISCNTATSFEGNEKFEPANGMPLHEAA